jgi:hypothetical protein
MKALVVALVVGAVFAAGASASLPQRLNKTQWAAYTKVNTAFTTQTPKSVARFRYCLSRTTGSRNARAMQQCFGNTADLELTATNNLFAQVQKFTGKTATAGACNQSLSGYQSQLFFWKSTITGVSRAVHSNVANVATITGQAQAAQQIYPKLTQAATAFTAACKPKS